MAKQDEIVQMISVLRKEVEILTTRLAPAGTGYLHTAIDVINGRIDELIGEAITPYFDNPDNNLSPRKLASEIYGEDVYDGYKEHTEAMEQARLRKIQDSAAGRSTPTLEQVIDDYEHTKEYYNKERNRPMEGENLPITDGLSNRSMKTMKEIYGQAVQTTSEMMQEELEPLPINTFE